MQYLLHKCSLQFMGNLNMQSWMTHWTQTGIFMVNPFFLKFAGLNSTKFLYVGGIHLEHWVCVVNALSVIISRQNSLWFLCKPYHRCWMMYGKNFYISKGFTVRVKLMFLSRFYGPCVDKNWQFMYYNSLLLSIAKSMTLLHQTSKQLVTGSTWRLETHTKF